MSKDLHVEMYMYIDCFMKLNIPLYIVSNFQLCIYDSYTSIEWGWVNTAENFSSYYHFSVFIENNKISSIISMPRA